MDKFLSHIPKYDGEIITPINCEELTGYTEQELYVLTGIFSYLPYEQLNGADIRGRYPNPNIVIYHEKVEVEVTLHIEENYIYDELVIVRTKDEGIGLKMLCSQIKEALKAQFDRIELEAARGHHEDGTEYIGYIIWAKYGFLMKEDYQKRFESLMKPINDERKNAGLDEIQLLGELISTEEGLKHWTGNEVGFTWMACFNLKQGSKNFGMLNQYLAKKGLEPI